MKIEDAKLLIEEAKLAKLAYKELELSNEIGTLEANQDVLKYKLLKQKFQTKYPDLKSLNLVDFLSFLDSIEDNSYFPIMIAFDMIKESIKYGINLNTKSEDGYTPLAYSIKIDSSLIMGLDVDFFLTKLLLENGADVNQKIDVQINNGDKISIPPLSFSGYIAPHKIQIAKLLLEYGAKLENDYNAFYALVNSPNRLYNDDRGFLQTAIDLQAHDLMELIVKKHIDENIPFAKGYCLNPLFDLQKEDELGNPLIETADESKITVQKIIKTLALFKKAGLKISDHFYHVIVSTTVTVPIEIDYDSTIGDAIELRHKLYIFDKGESTLLLLKYLLDIGAKICIGNIEKTIFELKMPDATALLIRYGANVNTIYHQGNDSLLMEVCSSVELGRRKLEFVKFLVENGANIHYKDSIGNTVLFKIVDVYQDVYHIDQYEDENGEIKTETFQYSELPSEKIMKYLIEKGADINAKNYMGMTPLMHHALKDNDRLVKILLDAGADINVKSEVTAYDLATKDEIKHMIANTKNHNPQKLVKLLSNFTIDKPMKYTTHGWDFGKLSNTPYQNFDAFMDAVTKQWENMKADLKELSPNLYKKINCFILEENPSADYSWCSQADINIGWSSLDGLKEWCDAGNDPFKFKLKKRFRVDDKTINIFGKVIDLFKQEIEMREDSKTLVNIFHKIRKEFEPTLTINYDSNKLNKQFYSDVQSVTEALRALFKQIQKRAEENKELNQVEIALSYPDSGYYELKILHKKSFSQKDPKELLEEVKNGDFAELKNKLENLCDWSVENRTHRINYLKSNNVKDVEELDTQAEGFTHILRFYK